MHLFRAAAIACGFLFLLALQAGGASASSGIAFSSGTIAAGGVVTMNSLGTCTVLTTMQLNSTTIRKTVGASIGSDTRITVSGCTGGIITAATIATPTTIQYSSFTGTLPNITEINTVVPNVTISATTPFGTCVYAGERRRKILLELLDVTIFRWISETVVKRSGSALCPSQVTIGGDLRTLGTPPTVRLV